MVGINRASRDAYEPLPTHIQIADETRAVTKPRELGVTWGEQSHDAAETEQLELWRERGIAAARDATCRAEEHADEALRHVARSNRLGEVAAADAARAKEAADVLWRHVRRPVDAKALKWLRWGGLLAGDIVGVAGAAVMLGEEPSLAVMQGTAGGVAAVTLGAVGREVRVSVSARARAKPLEELTEAERRYAQLFAGGHRGERLMTAVMLVAALGIAALVLSIATLRSSTEGGSAGLVFGGIALAVGLASFVNSFDTADEVAEHLDTLNKAAARSQEKADAAAASRVVKMRAQALAEAGSITAEHEAAALAHAAAVRREKAKFLNDNPAIVGNGLPAEHRIVLADGTSIPADLSVTTNGNGNRRA